MPFSCGRKAELGRPALLALASFDGAAGTEHMSSLLLGRLAQDFRIALWCVNTSGCFFDRLRPRLSSLHRFSPGRFAGMRNALRLWVSILVRRPAAIMVFEYRMGIVLAMALSWMPARWRPLSIFCHHVQLRPRLAYAPELEKRRVLRLFPLYDVHAVPSPPLAEELLASLPGLSADRLAVIPNGIDLAEIEAMAQAPMAASSEARYPCVCLGALRPDKHVDTAIRALALLPQHHEVLLWIIGDGPERGRLEALARELGVEGRCRFLGELANPHPYLAHAVLLVHISERETFGLAPLEAMAHGVPVLAMCRDAAGLGTVLEDGVQGMLLGDVGPALLARTWQWLLDHERERKAMGAAGRKQARAFDARVMVDRYRRLLGRGC